MRIIECEETLESGKTQKAYRLENIQQNSTIGFISKMRVGRFMHWCLSPKEDTYFTNGCLKEISKFITKLYKEDKVENIKDIWCVSCRKHHDFDMARKQVACPKEHPDIYA